MGPAVKIARRFAVGSANTGFLGMRLVWGCGARVMLRLCGGSVAAYLATRDHADANSDGQKALVARVRAV
jgi:hypothetical protein